MTVSWSIEAWCASQSPLDWSSSPQSTIAFLERLACPTVHPFCTQFDDNSYPLPGVPSQGPLVHRDHLETLWDVIVSAAALTFPPLLAMAELWLRLFACVVAPMGVTHLITQHTSAERSKRSSSRLIALLTLASSLVLATDSLYLLEFGPQLGRGLLVTSMALVWFQPRHLRYHRTLVVVSLFAVAYLTANSPAASIPPAGLYYDASSSFAASLVRQWPVHYRTYTDGTPWFPTGDSRTGLPFLIYSIPKPPVWNRVWLPVDNQNGTSTEVVALDFAFPAAGYQADRPVYLVLHGLNGGSQEAFVQDFTLRRIAEDEQATVVVMVARGLMDLPVRGWNIFHGARWEDAHAASQAVRRAVGEETLLVGVGYSMGAIVLSNLVSRVGAETALSAAVAVSGGLDMRQELKFRRAERLWQPLITPELRDTFVVGKFGERVRSRLSKMGLKKLMRATHVTAVDVAAVVEYNGFRNVEHYYAEMSALGDVPEDEFTERPTFDPSRRM